MNLTSVVPKYVQSVKEQIHDLKIFLSCAQESRYSLKRFVVLD